MKKIYIILTYSGSLLSKAIKIIERHEYTHVSISLDEELTKMYSFGRLKPYNAFIGGFVQESPNYGTFKRFAKTKSKILCINITEKQYKTIEDLINNFIHKKDIYNFNLIGLCSVALHTKVTRKNSFYCAEFIKYLFEMSNLNISLPELVTPKDFESIPNTTQIYTGYLKNYLN